MPMPPDVESYLRSLAHRFNEPDLRKAADEIERLRAELAEKNKRIEELEKAITDVHSTLVGCILIQRDGDPPLFTMWLDGHVLTPDLTNYVIIPAERYGETLQNGDGTLVGVQREPITHRLEGHATISLKKLTGERDE